MLRAALALGVAAALGLLAASCFTPPKVGDACNDAAISCFDPGTALECVGGIRVGVHCGGPKGCLNDGRMISCDQSEAKENDLCLTSRMQSFGDAACSPDKKTFLTCKQGRFVTTGVCRGPAGCGLTGGSAVCDLSLAQDGDPCPFEGKGACSADRAHLFECRGHRFTNIASCEGPDHCTVDARQIRCDQSVGTIGAACEKSSACSADKKSRLLCKDHVWELSSPCRGPEGCGIVSGGIACDTSVAVAGELCEGDGSTCAADARTMLKCDSGKWVAERACPRACEVRKSEHVVACK